MYLSTEQFTIPPVSPSASCLRVETLLEKGSSDINEDVLLESGRLFGVFDGATSLDKKRFFGGLTGGILAARSAASAFQEKGSSLYQLAEKANDQIRELLLSQQVSLTERHRLWSTSMAVIRLAEDHFEYCQTGDALILLIQKDGSHRLVTPDIDIDRETLSLWQRHKDEPTTSIHELLADQIRRVRLQMNISYGVLNGEPQALDFLNHGCMELADVTDILLFTDGLFLPKKNPQTENDWDYFVELYLRGGLQAIRDYVRQSQRSDPHLKEYPRFKLHDDIAAIAVNRTNSLQ